MLYLTIFLLIFTTVGTVVMLIMWVQNVVALQGSCQVTVNHHHRLTGALGHALLDQLMQHQVLLPSSCGGKGTCGLCRVVVKSGGGTCLPTELAYLSKSEQKQGCRLACQLKLTSDIQICVPDHVLAALLP